MADTSSVPLSGDISEIPHRDSYLLSLEEEEKRQFFAIACYGILLLVSVLVSLKIFGSPIIGIGLGVSAFLAIGGLMIKLFMVNVPEVTGLILINLLEKGTITDRFANMYVLLTGLHFKYPWEQAKDGLFINLRIVDQTFREDYPTAANNPQRPAQNGSAAESEELDQRDRKSGPLLKTEGDVLYGPVPELLPLYIAYDDVDIKTTLVGIATSCLSVEVAKRTPAQARNAIPAYQLAILDAFRAEGGVSPEERFAIKIQYVRVSDVDFEDDYQDILTVKARADVIEEIALQLRAHDAQLSMKDATDAAQVIAKIVPRTINENRNTYKSEGSAGEALAAILLNLGGNR